MTESSATCVRDTPFAILITTGCVLPMVGMLSSPVLAQTPAEEAEFAWMTRLSKETGRPVWFLLTDRTKDPARWRRLMQGVRKKYAID